MAPDGDRPARWATFALMAVAYGSCEVAAHPDGIPRPFGIAFGVFLFSVAAVASRLVPEPVPGQALPRKLVLVFVLALGFPVLVEPLVREVTGNGLPLELQLVNGLRNVGLVLTALAAWPRVRHLAGVVALFLALFASAMGDQPAIPYLLITFAIIGGVWLVMNHQADLTGSAVGTVAIVSDRVRLRVPGWEFGVLGVLLAITAGVLMVGPRAISIRLGELVPTSGGTGEYDPFSRGGVNDGPEETAGDDPSTAGMVDTDKMIESQQDSLIDAVSDMYGAPHKPRKTQERMVAAGFAEVKQSHNTPENKRPSRDFDTSRKGPPNVRKAEGQDARAIFEVEGRTPLHVRVVAYDRYNFAGRHWQEAAKPSARLIEPDPAGGDWMDVRGGRNLGRWYATDDRHVLKVADARENLVPTPALCIRVRIRRVDKPDYYEWDYDGVLALAGRKRTPSGTVVHTDSRTLDPADIPTDGFARIAGKYPTLDVPPELAAELARLAQEWAADHPRGWPQVAAVLDRLRTEYQLDGTTRLPPDHPAPVLWFLTESRRGPDYLFATSAALLLRTLGYPTRCCVGFYARPDAFDPLSQHTPVRATDLHSWAEVLLADNNWLVVEPTPGYATLPPLAPWGERMWSRAAEFAARIERNAVPLGLGVIAVSLIVLYRRRLWDAALTLRWRLAPGRTWDRVALRAAKLLERRAALAGRYRSPTETLSGWANLVRADESLVAAIRLAEWAAYAPGQPAPVPDPAEVCRAAVDSWTLTRFRSTSGVI